MRGWLGTVAVFSTCLVLTLATAGCKPSSKTGFWVGTGYCKHPINDPNMSQCDENVDVTQPMPYIPVSGTRSAPLPGMTGSVNQFGLVFTNTNVETHITATSYDEGYASVFIPNAEVPADWNMFAILPESCGTDHLYQRGVLPGTHIPFWEYEFPDVEMDAGGDDVWEYQCNTTSELLPASERFAIVGSFPSTLTLGGDTPFITQYGMPLLYVYDGDGLVTTETATGVSTDGSQATFPFPSSLPQNGYSLAVVNQVGGSYGQFAAGSNLLSIASRQTISGSPFGVAVGAQSIVTNTCVWVPTPPYGGHYQCTPTTTYNPVPVVSLYSAGQALVGGTRVTVGSNPTAVVTYTGNTSSTTTPNGNGYTTVTIAHQTRAAVANSGSNTVSILDIVNKVPVATITVGNRPVALAVSSDSSTGYVANYADRTVTKINLTTNTPSTTVAVGGNPTSLALTSAGILWVGGAGSLTQINTQTMTVVGTSTGTKNIIALGYSDSLNEILATTVDTNANVYADEIAPSGFHAGAAYTTLASNQVSGLGTYTAQPSGQLVRAFSATLASTSSISTNQVGAPPLVVQDGWAVVTATPTGFTITDASGHIVLVSERTPSPVTAIAVDTNLHVAYLTMPDSNTLLMVPLPGAD